MKILNQILGLKDTKYLPKVLKSIYNTEEPITKQAQVAVITKFNRLNDFYKQISGIDEIERYQNRAIKLNDDLRIEQDKRRKFDYLFQEIRQKIMAIQEELHKIKRYEQPGRFMELMQQETKLINQEQEAFRVYKEQERHERDLFIALSNALRDSQEKQRTRMEYGKFIGLGLTILGAIASYFITTWRAKELKDVIRTSIGEQIMDLSPAQTIPPNNNNRETKELKDVISYSLLELKSFQNSQQKQEQRQLDAMNQFLKHMNTYQTNLNNIINHVSLQQKASNPLPMQISEQEVRLNLFRVGLLSFITLVLCSCCCR